jgi:8-oxo-dGTP diphosphatase
MEAPSPAYPATLCYPIVDGEVLLIRKQRGLGAGKIVGPGGTVEPDETPRECVVREVREEVGVEVEPRKVGELDFRMGGEPETFAYVYRADTIDGDPRPSPEAVPAWYSVDDLPYREMWPADRRWVPLLLDDEYFEVIVGMDDAGETIERYERIV